MNQEIDVNCDPLPGYRLIERLGAGGYGEVWRAEAPGGLIKAIKFVFGTQHEKRATNEMRALDHVRSVRHPFLLSLERIEVVDGRLLVVTELADKSVKDHFDACRREGLRGIPRDELLGYLRDAADALDFMSETHALQHLDIKPENLLILAGHIKVADFGLVKDVRQSQASLVGGMTPLYAAPEVFRGVPSRHSDQYSLAIVYQEMLTGTLPFAGGNAAELTLQHLNDEPDLSALTVADRYAVSRALAKDPQHRYATCCEFIEALFKVASGATQFQAESQQPEFGGHPQFAGEASPQGNKTELFDDDGSTGWQAAPQLLADLPPSDCRIVDLPPVDLTGRDGRFVPTLVIGIGGTAGRVLSQLRRTIHDQFADNQIPSVQLLLLDTDSQALAGAAHGEPAGLTPDEMLNLPLRRPQHYRENSQQLLHWLSRRWLYNIPRSLRTEGLRPLGRLALTDHARQVGQRIRRSMLQAMDPESVTASCSAINQEFRTGTLRVVIVASISGGTGGGMSLDIGYAVRAILEKIGLAESRVIGIMMHSTDRDARQSELARVNAFSWLSEFNHFQQHEHAYPGDTSCGLPAHPAGVHAFDETYLLHLGENLDGAEFEQATQAVAEYLRLNSLSGASAFFDACRDTSLGAPESQFESSAFNLRSFGVCRRTPASREFCDDFAGTISQHVLLSWRDTDRNKPKTTVDVTDESARIPAAVVTSEGAPDGLQLVRRLQLDADGVTANARALVDLQLATDPASFLAAWLKKLGISTQDLGAQRRAIDQIFSGRHDGAADSENTIMGCRTGMIIKPLAEKLRSELRRWVSRRIDEPGQRVTGARRAVEWANQYLFETRTQLEQRQAAIAARISESHSAANSAIGDNPTKAGARPSDLTPPTAVEYFTLCLDRVAVLAAQNAISVLVSEAKALSDEVTALGREIDQIASAVGRANRRGANTGGDQVTDRSPSETRLAAEITAKLPRIAEQVDALLQSEYIESNGGLAKTIMQGGRPRAQLTAKLHELSRQAIYHALNSVDVLASGSGSGNSTDDDLKTSLALATPSLLQYGGGRRVLVVLPPESLGATSRSAISERLGTTVTAATGTDSGLTLCVEADGLSLPHIAMEFVERRRDRVEFAGRVHCRTDIPWMPLLSTATPTDSSAWSTDEARQTQSQNAMCKTLVL